MLQSKDEVAGGGGGGVSGRQGGHGEIVGKKFHGAANAFLPSFRNVSSVAAVVFRSGTNIPSVNAMGCPRFSLGWVFVDNDFGAGRRKRGSVVVESPIEDGFGRKAGIDARRSKQVECCDGQRYKAAPQVHGEIGIYATKAGNKMVFERADDFFGRVGAMEVRWHKLKIDAAVMQIVLGGNGAFIVHDVELGMETTSL